MNTVAHTPATPSKPLGYSLWTVQVLLAAVFLMAGATKLGAPLETIRAQMPWAADAPDGLIRFIGLAELLGAIGLIAPAATRIQPALTPLAAVGLTTVMALAGLTHLVRGEYGSLVPALVIGLLTAFVAWGRGSAAPIAPR